MFDSNGDVQQKSKELGGSSDTSLIDCAYMK